jgi:2-polyprenyl-6-methoxyphenol hydroxylase-like FAD-dependent oxidoreductase
MLGINKTLIVGGGIGGLSTAIGPRKGGIQADIVEIKERWEVHHVGIIVHANFLRAMVALGIADRCVAAGFPYQHIRHYDSRGNFLFVLEGQQLAGPDYPASLGLRAVPRSTKLFPRRLSRPAQGCVTELPFPRSRNRKTRLP